MKFTLWALLVLAFGVTAGIFRAVAFTGPVVGAGTGAGAIGTDAAGNVSIGTSTTDSATKLLVVGSTTNSSAYGLQVWNSAKTTLLSVRNDGAVSIPGPLTATVNASNITSGQFAAGNFSFSGNLAIGTSSPAANLELFQTSANAAVPHLGGTLRLSNGYGDGGANNWNVNSDYAGSIDFFNSDLSGGNGANVIAYIRPLVQTNFGAGWDLVFGEGVNNAAATEKMRLTGAGNLGIGTAAPTSTLTVAGEIKTTSGGVRFPDGTLQTTAGGGGGGQWTTSGTTIFYNGGNVGIGVANTTGRLTVSAGVDRMINFRGDPASFGLAEGGIILQGVNSAQSAEAPITLEASGVYFNPTGGYVGIGTTTPQRLLSLSAGGGNAFVRFTDTTAGSGSGWDVGVNNGSSMFLIRDTQAAAYRMAIDNSGNVGIGTTAPGQKLTVLTNSAALTFPAQIANQQDDTTSTAAGLLFTVGTGGTSRGKGAIAYQGDGTGYNHGDFLFLQNSTADTSNATLSNAVMTIKNNGNVGIGTTTPNVTLDVNGGVHVESTVWPTAGAGLELEYNAAATTTYILSYTRTGGAWLNGDIDASKLILQTNSGGNVGIGTITPAQKLSVVGTIESTSGGFKFPDGTTQVTAAGGVSPHIQKFTAGGTWTYPAGVSEAWVTMCGGGGGGGLFYVPAAVYGNGTAGGASSFGALTANGGNFGYGQAAGNYVAGGMSGGGALGGPGAVSNGIPGSRGSDGTGDGIGTSGGGGGGGGWGSPSVSAGAQGGNAGGFGGGVGGAVGSAGGGGGGGASSLGAGGAGWSYCSAFNGTGYGGGGGGLGGGGGGGAQCVIHYPVAVNANVSVTIGAGGAGANNGCNAGNGAPGVAIVEWYQ